MQIVLSGNRVIAHGEDRFLCMGGTVICEDTGKAYPNATIAEVDSVPADIDTVGYEYHAGVFVPCAPYGKGGGNLMVACEECGTPKSNPITASEDGGLNVPGYLTGCKVPDDIAALYGLNSGAELANVFSALSGIFLRFESGSYVGKDEYGRGKENGLSFNFQPRLLCIEGHAIVRGQSDLTVTGGSCNFTWDGNTVKWYSLQSYLAQMNSSLKTYHWIAIG